MKPFKTFIIRHKETKEQWISSSGKSSWKAVGHAKNAWVGSIQPEEFQKETKYSWKENMKFDEQDVYEVMEVKPESGEKLEEACKILKECYSWLNHYDCYYKDTVVKFLKENDK